MGSKQETASRLRGREGSFGDLSTAGAKFAATLGHDPMPDPPTQSRVRPLESRRRRGSRLEGEGGAFGTSWRPRGSPPGPPRPSSGSGGRAGLPPFPGNPQAPGGVERRRRPRPTSEPRWRRRAPPARRILRNSWRRKRKAPARPQSGRERKAPRRCTSLPRGNLVLLVEDRPPVHALPDLLAPHREELPQDFLGRWLGPQLNDRARDGEHQGHTLPQAQRVADFLWDDDLSLRADLPLHSNQMV